MLLFHSFQVQNASLRSVAHHAEPLRFVERLASALKLGDLAPVGLLPAGDLAPDVVAGAREEDVLPRSPHRRQLARYVRRARDGESHCPHERAGQHHRENRICELRTNGSETENAIAIQDNRKKRNGNAQVQS